MFYAELTMRPTANGPTIDVRGIAPGDCHATVFAAFCSLGLDETLEIVSDHDGRPLYHHFQIEAPGNFSWVYGQSGPEVWRVCITKLARAHGSGECCGVCCTRT